MFMLTEILCYGFTLFQLQNALTLTDPIVWEAYTRIAGVIENLESTNSERLVTSECSSYSFWNPKVYVPKEKVIMCLISLP